MPYIKKEDRKKFDAMFMVLPEIENKGELEFIVYKLMNKYMSDKERRYSTLHDCTYAVQHCADEFRRRNLDAREDEARETNGDV